MSELEAIVAIFSIVAVFGTGGYIMHNIFKLIRHKIDKKNNALDPDVLKELKDYKSFKLRTENRLRALEHIATIEEDEENQVYIDYESEPEPAKKSDEMKSRLKNQLKS